MDFDEKIKFKLIKMGFFTQIYRFLRYVLNKNKISQKKKSSKLSASVTE